MWRTADSEWGNPWPGHWRIRPSSSVRDCGFRRSWQQSQSPQFSDRLLEGARPETMREFAPRVVHLAGADPMIVPEQFVIAKSERRGVARLQQFDDVSQVH